MGHLSRQKEKEFFTFAWVIKKELIGKVSRKSVELRVSKRKDLKNFVGNQIF